MIPVLGAPIEAQEFRGNRTTRVFKVGGVRGKGVLSPLYPSLTNTCSLESPKQREAVHYSLSVPHTFFQHVVALRS